MTNSSTPTENISYRNLITDTSLLAIVLISVTGVSGNAVVSPVLPQIAGEFSASTGRVGYMISALTFPSLLLAPVIGILADFYGRRTIVLIALLTFGIGGVGIVFANSFTMIIALRLIQGVGFAGLMSLSITMLGDAYVGAAGSAAQGFRQTANGIGSVALPIVVGALSAIAWNYPFLLYGMAFPIAILVYLYVPSYLPENGRSGDVSERIRTYFRDLKIELTDTDLRVLVISGFPRFMGLYSLLTFVPLFAADSFGASPLEIGVVMAVLGLTRMLAPASGLVLTRATRKQGILLGLSTSAVAMGLFPTASSIHWLAVLVGVYGLGDAVSTPILTDSVTAIPDNEHRAGVVSSMQFVKDSGKTISPVLFGAVLSWTSFRTVFLFGGLIVIGYGAVVWRYLDQDPA